MKDKQLSQSKLAYHTFKNASVSILLAILVIIFNLVRTGLTSATFGLDSLGLLALAISILPYISGGHNSFFNVATAKLYKSIHLKQYHEANKHISDLRPQFYMFGCFYLGITVLLAFAFPFIAAGHTGTITVREEHGNYTIEWWQSTLFILSNTIELFSTYFIIPISMILLFINNKSYIYNGYDIIITILFNAIIITLFCLQLNGIITISFIWMNIIIILLLGTKVIFVLLILYPYRKKYFGWYQKQKSSSWKIDKETWESVGTAFLDQFSTDVITILFLVYSAVKTTTSAITSGTTIELQHGGGGGTGFAPDGFIPASVYFVFMTLLTSGNKVVHSIIDAAIPSLAEHATHNDTKINKHFFHRFQMLNIFIASFTASNFILTAPMLNSVLMFHEHDTHANLMDATTLNIFIGLLWVPLLIDIFNGMYTHILSMFGEFKKTLKISAIRAGILLVLFLVLGSIIFTSLDQSQWTYAIYGTIISCSALANLVIYFISRKKVQDKIIATDGCFHLLSSTLLSFTWLVLSLIIMLPQTMTMADSFIDLTHDKSMIGQVIGVAISISLCNMVLNVLNLYWFRSDDFNYYYKEIKEHINVKA